MTRRDLAELVLLGALWGASFLFMRVASPEFGPLALVFVRVAGAGLLLLPLLAWRGELAALRTHWRPIAVVGLFNSSVPFLLFMVAALVLGSGLMAVFNATTPIWGALVARVWLGERLAPSRALGLAVGVGGVLGLVWGQADFKPGDHGISPALAMVACVVASFLYGVAAILTRRWLDGVPPMAAAAGSQCSAALTTVLPAAIAWPAINPPPGAWWAAVTLALACTGLAYVLYFRLIAHAGATNAMSVTFLIPGFAMLWGWLFLDEQPGPATLAWCAVILLGTALATGTLHWPGAEKRPRSGDGGR